MRMVSDSGASPVPAGGGASRAMASDSSAARRCQATYPARPARPRKGSNGMPGSSPIIAAPPPASAMGFHPAPSWPTSALSGLPSPLPLVTTMPAATETSSAGIWLTNPSPTVRMVKVSTASPKLIPWRATPMAMPPIRLITVMMRPAMASPRTNFAAPSMEP